MTVNTPFFISPARSGGHAEGVAIAGKLTRVEDGKVGSAEVFELLLGRADEHVAHEQGVVGAGANDADLEAVRLLGAGKAVEDVETVAGVEVVDGTLAVDHEGVFVELGVHRAPPHVVTRHAVLHDSLVAGTPAGLVARGGDQSAGRGEEGARLVPQSVLVKDGDGLAPRQELFRTRPSTNNELAAARRRHLTAFRWTVSLL
ncbi:MAG: hypothetical protein BJ554DRAFT_478 [Olpidium bornovanus]|uniref:Uncharacterized protein n=1 Tax=Olpidium bornovanus TaxID=278681 RepID=A0A8H8DI38_9FUNG|nr:MAG: hypothetical protein BJ554DRAFT_478 [Olpidium bornovanus]